MTSRRNTIQKDLVRNTVYEMRKQTTIIIEIKIIIVTVKTETETAMEETERIIRRNIQINQSVLYLSAD